MMMGFFSERGIEIAIAAAAVSVVALIGGLMTDVGPWYESLRFPRLRPPNWLFGPAWTVIFILIAAAGVIAWESAEDPATRFRLVILFFDQRRLEPSVEPAVLQDEAAGLGAL